VLTAQKIRGSFQGNPGASERIAGDVASQNLLQASDVPPATGDILTSPSGRIGCMVVFDTEEKAKKAMTTVDFFASHDGEKVKSQVLIVVAWKFDSAICDICRFFCFS
jgi:hypothetical protein